MKQSEDIEVLTEKQLKRKLIYNAVPNELAEATCVIAGLDRSSPDVEEMEKRASAQRYQQLLPILPVVTALADSLAEVASAVAIDNLKENVEGLPEELEQAIATVSTQNMRSTIISILSVLIDLGIIDINGIL